MTATCTKEDILIYFYFSEKIMQILHAYRLPIR